MASIYAGYELVADIDFAGPDGDPDATVDNLDENGGTAGNIDPIAGDFTAIFHGNGHEIANMDISSAAEAALFLSCSGAIHDLTLADPSITGITQIAALCATANNATISNVSVTGGDIEGGTSSATIRMGGLIAILDGTSRVIACSFSGTVSNGGTGSDNMGGLVGTAWDNAQIIGSRASGTVSDGGVAADNMGGLVGTAWG